MACHCNVAMNSWQFICDFGCKDLIRDDFAIASANSGRVVTRCRSATLSQRSVCSLHMWFLWNQKTGDMELPNWKAWNISNTFFAILLVVFPMLFYLPLTCILHISVIQKNKVSWNNTTILSCNINIKFLWIGDSWNLQSKGKPHESKANSIKSIAVIRNLSYPVYIYTLKTSTFFLRSK